MPVGPLSLSAGDGAQKEAEIQIVQKMPPGMAGKNFRARGRGCARQAPFRSWLL